MKRALKKIFLITVIITGFAFYSQAQTAAKPADAKAAVPKGAASYIDVFFKKYKTSPDSAIDYLFGTNQLFNNVAQISLLKSKLDSLQLSLGKYTGKELIAQKSASPGLVIYSYLVKHENQPVRFIIMFYKPKNDWVLYRFTYDDQLDQELIEAVKINNKRP